MPNGPMRGDPEGALNDYQRGYVDGFDAPRNAEAREALDYVLQHIDEVDGPSKADIERRLRGALGSPKPGTCPISSAITGQPCVLPEGHDQNSPERFHRYAPADEDDLRPCPSCGALLTSDETHWSLFPEPAGGWVCPTATRA